VCPAWPAHDHMASAKAAARVSAAHATKLTGSSHPNCRHTLHSSRDKDSKQTCRFHVRSPSARGCVAGPASQTSPLLAGPHSLFVAAMCLSCMLPLWHESTHVAGNSYKPVASNPPPPPSMASLQHPLLSVLVSLLWVQGLPHVPRSRGASTPRG
jgi:hypothetical protein